MKITISGQKVELGHALQEHVEAKLEESVSKYFTRALNADVMFTKESHLFVARIQVDEGVKDSIYIRSEAKNDDIYAAFEQSLEKIEKQLRRYNRRLRDHGHKKPYAELSEDELSMLATRKYVFSDENDGEANAEDNPLIIAEKASGIDILTVSDAVMRMNLADLPALMFINKKNNCVSVVYRRKDGNVSWVDSAVEANTASAKKKAAA